MGCRMKLIQGPLESDDHVLHDYGVIVRCREMYCFWQRNKKLDFGDPVEVASLSGSIKALNHRCGFYIHPNAPDLELELTYDQLNILLQGRTSLVKNKQGLYI